MERILSIISDIGDEDDATELLESLKTSPIAMKYVSVCDTALSELADRRRDLRSAIASVTKEWKTRVDAERGLRSVLRKEINVALWERHRLTDPDLASRIEESLYGHGAEKFMEVLAHISTNRRLLERLVESPELIEQLPHMSRESMEIDHLVECEREIRSKVLAGAERRPTQRVRSEIVACKKCKGRNCTYEVSVERCICWRWGRGWGACEYVCMRLARLSMIAPSD
jgi:hypothetical protein